MTTLNTFVVVFVIELAFTDAVAVSSSGILSCSWA